jgi:hypothetical protein
LEDYLERARERHEIHDRPASQARHPARD